MRECDYLVIGAGASGCAVAGRLSEYPNVEVVLLEAGDVDRSLMTKVPGIAFLASASSRRNWNFLTEPIAALNGRRLQWNQGRTVGGSSSINGMLYMRGHAREYDQWGQMGCTGWSFDDVLPLFKKSETNARGESEWHGGSGPLRIKPSKVDLPICDAFLSATAQAGYPIVSDLNTNILEGFGYFDANIHQGRRVSAADAFVVPAQARKNFTLIFGALANRIVIENGKVGGVEFLQNAERKIVRVRREVILCGGAVNSPHLLMLSGIGPAEHLRGHGIEVVVDAPDVGSNLRNHPAYRLSCTCSTPVTAFKHLSPWNATKAVLQYATSRSGVLSETYVATGGVYKSNAALDVPDIIAVMAPALLKRGVTGSRLRDLFPHEHGFSVSVSCGRPMSVGTIRLRSSDPTDHPSIQPNYFSNAMDMQAMVNAIKIMRDILRRPGIRSLIDSDVDPDPAVKSDSELEADIRNKCGTFWHPSGTCRMGSDEHSVVDPRLRVRGLQGLRVADTSIMPTALNACTHGPAIMIGEKAASMITGLKSEAAIGRKPVQSLV